MKDVEVRLVSELMKNSRRSDKELGKALGVSQPTVSRMIGRLEKEGVVREYTMIPDFCKLGFNLMAVIMLKLRPLSPKGVEELQKASRELDMREKRPYLMVMDGIGMGKDMVLISFHRNYGDYETYIRDVKEAASSRMKAYVNMEDIDGFIVDLNYGKHYQPLTFSRVAAHLRTKNGSENEQK